MSAEQLQLDGGATPIDDKPSTAPLTAAQKAILYRARENGGTIRAVEAGTIVHAGRTPQGCNHARGRNRYSGGGCCRYAASDGTEACKRLVKCGLLVRTESGYGVPR